MSKVYADTVTSTEANRDLTLGGSGDNVIVTAGATLKTNTIKDSGGNTLWTSDGSGNLSSINSALGSSNQVLLSTQTVSSAVATVDFTTGIDSTYKLYIFKWYDWQGVGDGSALKFQANVAGQSGFNETITSTTFRVYQTEDGNSNEFAYTDYDQAQGTDYQFITSNTGNDNDQSSAGVLYLFNPSNTTYVKHFYAQGYANQSNDGAFAHFTAGYFNVTGAIDEISFKMNTGNIDAGTIKMYGVG